jgi:hypothetical protein
VAPIILLLTKYQGLGLGTKARKEKRKRRKEEKMERSQGKRSTSDSQECAQPPSCTSQNGIQDK